MVGAKRLYVYTVMGVALALLLWGLASALRLGARAAAAVVGDRDAVGADVALDELSLAVALVVVALPIWLIHAWLAQRPLAGPPDMAADERASPQRATYFFLVLAITGGVALLQLYESLQEVFRVTLADERAWGLAGAAAALVVTAVAWLGHIWWRRSDMLAAPARIADDWLTRAYLYSGLFILAVLLAFWIGSAAAVILDELVSARPPWDPWQEAFAGPAAGTIGAAVGWTAQWLIARWLLRAQPPLGSAHRASRTRTGYFLATVLVCAAAVIVLLVASLQHVFAYVLGVWRSNEGSRWIEDVAGPLIMASTFAVAWWWHWRRAMGEAMAFGGPERHAIVRRSGLYVLAFVGLAGLAIGVAQLLEAGLTYGDAARESGRSAALRDGVAPSLAAVLVGLLVWAPTWLLVRRDFAAAPASVAASLQRRAYLLLVSAVAVVALMGSVALIVYRLISLILGAGEPEGDGWAVAVALVSAVVLVYHLWRLRLDGQLVGDQVAPVAEPTAEVAATTRVVETIVISAPAERDMGALNEAIRERLPDDVEMRVIGEPPAQG